MLELADGWYPLTGPTLLEDAARLRAAVAEQGRTVEVSVCEMAGQMAGVPWYCDEATARQSLSDLVQRYADGGIDRIVIGVPVDSVGSPRGCPRRARRARPDRSADGDRRAGARSPASSVRG